MISPEKNTNLLVYILKLRDILAGLAWAYQADLTPAGRKKLKDEAIWVGVVIDAAIYANRYTN